MAWIESHTVLLRHRKVLLLATDLNVTPVAIVGHLHVLWHAILEQQEDGDLRDWPDEMIAQAAAYTGDARAFVLALQSRKWLDGKIVHDWIEYAGRYLQSKYRTANQSKLEKIFKKHQSVRKSVSSQTKDRLKSAHLTRPNHPNLDDLTRPNQDNHSADCAEVQKPLAPPKSAAVFAAYSLAYQSRYGVAPVRNQQTNSMLCKLVDKLGAEAARAVASYYLTHNQPFYVAKRHPVNLLLADAEGLHTQWATGIKATTLEGKQAELKDSVVEQVRRVELLMKGRTA